MSDRTDQAASTGSAVQITAISDGDALRTDDLAARRRARVTVADAEAAFRAELIEDYLRARRTGSWSDELRVLAEAARYDRAHPGEPPLYDELHAIEMFGEQYSEVAA